MSGDDDGDDACLLAKRSRRSSSVGVLHRICSSFFLSFFLWDPQAQCLTVSKFCFVVAAGGNQFFVETNYYYYFLVNLMRILGSCLFFFPPLSLDLDSADLFFLENFSPEMSSLLLSGDLKNWVLLR